MNADREPLVDGLSLMPDGRFFVTYSDEASVRRMVATLARAYGWPIVKEEVVIPGWGRVDLLLQMSEKSPPHLFELKLDLSKPSLIRRAFQQADGYGRWWEANKHQEPEVYLGSCTGNRDAVIEVWNAYSRVTFDWVERLTTRLALPEHSAEQREAVARERIQETERRLKLQRRCLEVLESARAEHEAKERDWFEVFTEAFIGGGEAND